ncbi:hypothetical protein GCM10010531_30290 [Blastococcus jejuensis]|uniref:Uncharacterized protein n=1 Tax=Blastococcus jejuensis TaxID=351224 RepID=A0ABP6PC23_9ACTN
MSRTYSWVYLVAFTVWVSGWLTVLALSDTTGTAITVAVVCVACSNTVVFAVAWLRVQRGEAWGEAAGTVVPIMTEFVLMQLGLRLPVAVASLRSV